MKKTYTDTHKPKGLIQARVANLILDTLFNASTPLAATEIISALEILQTGIHKSSIYRALDSLLEDKRIVELDFQEGQKRYEAGKGHHHHLICRNCHKITHIDLDKLEQSLVQTEAKVSQEQGFKITDHTLELYGTCGGCQ